MGVAYYITHPEITMDPKVPVPQWDLSGTGRERAERFAARALLPADAIFVSSDETKAKTLARILARPHANRIVLCPECGENDRSATGFLPPDVFERQVTAFFAVPDKSADGWERAVDAQARIVAAVEAAIAASAANGPLVFTGHGGVGTLLKCHIAGRKIARAEDQREIAHPGGGNLFAFDLAAGRLLCDWTALEDFRELNHGGG